MLRLALLLAFATSGAVAAQSDDPESVFEAGVRAMEREDWLAAEVLFREAYEAERNDRYRLNLAEASFRRGGLLAARADAEGVAQGDDLLLREAAQELLRRIERDLVEVRLEAPALDPDDVSFRLDGRAVDAGDPQVLDPGTYTAELYADDRLVAVEELTLERGERRTVTMEADLSPEAAARTIAEEPDVVGVSPRVRRRRLAIGIAAAVVAVALTVGLAVGLRDDEPAGMGRGMLSVPLP
ncbi:MAG: hypothetical protein JJ863_37585 [Deltaproteobacteria bacterium]|nr:hypothetical protein [Deltaproteobacteria bacterium]